MCYLWDEVSFRWSNSNIFPRSPGPNVVVIVVVVFSFEKHSMVKGDVNSGDTGMRVYRSSVIVSQVFCKSKIIYIYMYIKFRKQEELCL